MGVTDLLPPTMETYGLFYLHSINIYSTAVNKCKLCVLAASKPRRTKVVGKWSEGISFYHHHLPSRREKWELIKLWKLTSRDTAHMTLIFHNIPPRKKKQRITFFSHSPQLPPSLCSSSFASSVHHFASHKWAELLHSRARQQCSRPAFLALLVRKSFKISLSSTPSPESLSIAYKLWEPWAERAEKERRMRGQKELIFFFPCELSKSEFNFRNKCLITWKEKGRKKKHFSIFLPNSNFSMSLFPFLKISTAPLKHAVYVNLYTFFDGPPQYYRRFSFSPEIFSANI